jgi:hypothetical protein
MSAMKDQLGDLLDQLTKHGQTTALLDTALPTDEQLWNLAHRTAPQLLQHDYAAATEQPDGREYVADWIEQFREAYDEGRRPGEINLGQLARALEALGVPAAVEYDNGGNWMLNAGHYFNDEEGETRLVVSGGPGQQRSPGVWWAERYEFSFGPAFGPRRELASEQAGEDFQRIAELAVRIKRAVRTEELLRGYDAERAAEHKDNIDQRVKRAVQEGIVALYTVVARYFPEVKGGDVDPGEAFTFDQDVERSIRSWLYGNQPEGTWTLPAEPVVVEPSPLLAAWAVDLEQRQQQLAGRTLRDGNQA